MSACAPVLARECARAVLPDARVRLAPRESRRRIAVRRGGGYVQAAAVLRSLARDAVLCRSRNALPRTHALLLTKCVPFPDNAKPRCSVVCAPNAAGGGWGDSCRHPIWNARPLPPSLPLVREWDVRPHPNGRGAAPKSSRSKRSCSFHAVTASFSTASMARLDECGVDGVEGGSTLLLLAVDAALSNAEEAPPMRGEPVLPRLVARALRAAMCGRLRMLGGSLGRTVAVDDAHCSSHLHSCRGDARSLAASCCKGGLSARAWAIIQIWSKRWNSSCICRLTRSSLRC